jgi:hypothetical protein
MGTVKERYAEFSLEVGELKANFLFLFPKA